MKQLGTSIIKHLENSIYESILDGDDITAQGENALLINHLTDPDSGWFVHRYQHLHIRPDDIMIAGNKILIDSQYLSIERYGDREPANVPPPIQELTCKGGTIRIEMDELNPSTLCPVICAYNRLTLSDVRKTENVTLRSSHVFLRFQFLPNRAIVKNVRFLREKGFHLATLTILGHLPDMSSTSSDLEEVWLIDTSWADEIKTPLWDDMLADLPYSTNAGVVDAKTGQTVVRKIRGWRDIVSTLNNPKKYTVVDLKDLIRLDKNVCNYLGFSQYKQLKIFKWSGNNISFKLSKEPNSWGYGVNWESEVELGGPNKGWYFAWGRNIQRVIRQYTV